MPRVQWPLVADSPSIQVNLVRPRGGVFVGRDLLADTGAGTSQAAFELLLNEPDCVASGGWPVKHIVLGGAYAGAFPVYLIRVQIPALGFDRRIPAVGVQQTPAGFGGIACFRFLNRFTYGNFGDPIAFGLEM